jgi:hypothetical protein
MIWNRPMMFSSSCFTLVASFPSLSTIMGDDPKGNIGCVWWGRRSDFYFIFYFKKNPNQEETWNPTEVDGESWTTSFCLALWSQMTSSIVSLQIQMTFILFFHSSTVFNVLRSSAESLIRDKRSLIEHKNIILISWFFLYNSIEWIYQMEWSQK